MLYEEGRESSPAGVVQEGRFPFTSKKGEATDSSFTSRGTGEKSQRKDTLSREEGPSNSAQGREKKRWWRNNSFSKAAEFRKGRTKPLSPSTLAVPRRASTLIHLEKRDERWDTAFLNSPEPC